MKGVVKDIIQWWPVVGLLMLISSLPFGWNLYQCISLCILGSGYVIDYFVNKEWLQIKWNRSKWIYVIMLVLFALPYLRQLFDPIPASNYFWHQMRFHEWMGIVGIIGILGYSRKLQLQQVAFIMLATSVAMAVYCAYLLFNNGPIDLNTWWDQYDKLRWTHINSHMVMNLFVNTSVILSLWWLHLPNKWWWKLLIIFSIFTALSVVFLSKGRVGQVTAMVILYSYVLYHIRHKNWGWYALALLLIGSSIWGVIQLNDRFNADRIQQDPRFAVWDYSMRQISQNPICGYGYSSLDSTYVKGLYTDSVAYYGFTKRILGCPDFAEQGTTLSTHHPHNAFLLYWLAMGLPGLVGLILLFGVALALPMARNDRFFVFLFVLACLMQSMFEPLGDHIRPQFICLVLFVLQRTLCAMYQISDTEPR